MRQMSQNAAAGSGSLYWESIDPDLLRSTELDADKPVLPVIYLAKCNGCGRCTEVCPAKALRVEQGRVRLIHTNCDYCGECEAACPTGAIACPFDIVWEPETAPTGNH